MFCAPYGRPAGDATNGHVLLSFWSSSSCFCSLPHGVETSFSRLLRRILSTSSSLDLCVFAFSNMDLSRAIVALHSRGVTIRVLSDKDYAAITGSQIGVLRKAGKGNTSVYFLNHCQIIMPNKKKPRTQAHGGIFNTYRDIICQTKSHQLLWGSYYGQISLEIQERGLWSCSTRGAHSVLGLSVSLSVSLTGFLSGEKRGDQNCLGEWRLPLQALL